jgi:2-methylisocitrate lyase-like PEP mutase family enzyme
LTAFADAGADVLYAPYPSDMDHVQAIIKAVAPKPVNLLIGTKAGALPLAELQKAGVKRVSLGGALYLRAMAEVQKSAEDCTRHVGGARRHGVPVHVKRRPGRTPPSAADAAARGAHR